jgi:hypothetical protein
LTFPCRLALKRLQRQPDRIDLARQEVLALGILGKLAAHDRIKVVHAPQTCAKLRSFARFPDR